MTIEKKYFENVDETLYSKTLDSGLKVYFMPKKGFMKKQVYFVTKYGALYNQFKIDGEFYSMPYGIAHFLEHQIFESEEGQNAFARFGELGGDVNAFTSFLGTAYTVSCVDNFYENLEELMKMVQSTNITEKSVEKEKGIIIQEIKMYEDEPDFVAYFSAVKSMYHHTPINIDVAGDVQSVTETTKEELEWCYNSFYTPQNMFMLVVGDLEEEKLFDQIEAFQSEDFIKRNAEAELIMEHEPAEILNKETTLSMEVSKAQFYLGFKGQVKSETYLKDFVALKLANDVVFSKSGPIFNRLYNKGLVNGNFGSELNRSPYYAYTIIGGEGEYTEKIQGIILDELSKILKNGFSEENFERTKKKFLGHAVSSFNSVQSVASMILRFNMKDIDIFEYLDKIKEVSYEDALLAFNEFYNPEDYTITWLKPIEKEVL